MEEQLILMNEMDCISPSLPRFDTSSKIEDWKDSINFLTVRINPFTPRGLPQTPRNIATEQDRRKELWDSPCSNKTSPYFFRRQVPSRPY